MGHATRWRGVASRHRWRTCTRVRLCRWTRACVCCRVVWQTTSFKFAWRHATGGVALLMNAVKNSSKDGAVRGVKLIKSAPRRGAKLDHQKFVTRGVDRDQKLAPCVGHRSRRGVKLDQKLAPRVASCNAWRHATRGVMPDALQRAASNVIKSWRHARVASCHAWRGEREDASCHLRRENWATAVWSNSMGITPWRGDSLERKND